MKWKITGADSKTGKDRILSVDAISEDAAIIEAKAQGVFPYSVAIEPEIPSAALAEVTDNESRGHIRTFERPLPQVFTAAQRAIRDLEYVVDSLDKANGLLNFKTGMSWKSWAGQEMSIMFIDNGDDTVEVTITGRREQTGVVLQVYDWGEASGIISKVYKHMNHYL